MTRQTMSDEAMGCTVGDLSYERARGLRAVGERPEGYSVTAQKTVER